MLARLINEKFANRKDGNQLSEVYEQLAVVSEVEPEPVLVLAVKTAVVA